MARSQPEPRPAWTDVKTRLAGLDRPELLSLIQDLYAAAKENQTFLHARFDLGADVLNPYKETIARWLWPDASGKRNTSVMKAKQAISQFRKAIGEAAGMAELMVFFCEQAVGFCNDVACQEESYLDALVRMFDQALTVTNQLPAGQRGALLARLDQIRLIAHDIGYGVGDDMDSLIAKYARAERPFVTGM